MVFNFVRGYVYVTSACNYRCSHCFIRSDKKYIKPEEIDIELVRQFIDDFGSNFKSINFTGEGNPILARNIKDIIRLSKMRVDTVSINTRGYINPDLLDYFKIMGVIVYYSIDWYGERADSEMRYDGLWEQQINTLKEMLKRKIRVAVRSTIMRDNFGDVLQLIRMVENLRLRGHDIVIEIMPYLPYNNTNNTPTIDQIKLITTICLNKDFTRLLTPWWTCIYPYFRDKASKWWHKHDRICEAGREYGRIAIKQDGTILPCPFETRPVGKYIRQYGSYYIDKTKVKIELDRYLNETRVDEKCEKCTFGSICKGCRVIDSIGEKQICPIPEMWR